ncbi:hypothetical protein Tco_0074752, partial [Tanacetum coccineum]
MGVLGPPGTPRGSIPAYDDVDAATIDKYLEVFKDEHLKPGGDSV